VSSYDGDVTQPREGGDPESQWQQPPFDPAAGQVAPAGQSGWLVVPTNGMGSDLVPADRRPPTVLESTLRVVSGVVWPVFLGLAFFHIGNWALNVFAAIVVSSLLGGIATELRRRRKYQPPAAGELPPVAGDLR
jgi:hypothetical protein